MAAAFVAKYGVGDAANLDTTGAEKCVAGGADEPEPALDVQMVLGTAPNATIKYRCGPKGHSGMFCHALLDYLVWAYETADASLIHSFSYGDGKCQDSVRGDLDTELQKLATKRVTTLWASGDRNAPGLYPASSAFATAVGGVQLSADSSSLENWHSFPVTGTGGGFDTKEAAPAYMANFTAAYLANASVPSKKPTTGRGYPDLAHFASDVCIADSCAEAGTSAATPIVASLVAMLNAVRYAANKTALGFINPLLYANPHAFLDVTAGKDNGYPLASGWDPNTGLGVPQLDELRKVVLALP